MKLLNYTSAYFAGILLVLLTIWAGIFYYSMLDEIYDSIDDGLDNQKLLIIQKAANDSTVLRKSDFDETDYAIREIPADLAIHINDTYNDTMMYMQNEKSDEPVRLLTTVFLQDGRYYRLQVATSMVEEDDLIKQLLYSILWLYAGLVITIVLFNNFLLKRIWGPFNHLLRQLKIFRLDESAPIVTAKTGVNEFKMLNETVKKLIQRNIDTYTRQKTFIENAAHELQTPLAISINKLETLAESYTLDENQGELLASAMDNLERLTRLNKSLLLLSRIENNQFGGEALVDMGHLIKKITDDFADQATFNDLSFTITEKETCRQRMNPDLAQVLLTNLVKNAIIHNIPGGFVHIFIHSDVIIFENPGSESLHSDKIFERFHTGSTSRESTGLGLAIAQAITKSYGFSIEYAFAGMHRMTLKFQ